MEIACMETARAVGAEPQRAENTCTVSWSVPDLEACSEEDIVSGGFSDDVCSVCCRRFALSDHQTERFIKHVDEVCCHLCKTKFSHMNVLVLHLKNAHPKYHMFCKGCNTHMGRPLSMERTEETDKAPETPRKNLLDEDMEIKEVIIENEEVEIKYEKEEEEEVGIGRMDEPEEYSTTETPEDNKMVNRNLHDHTYFSTQSCSSIRETTNNVVMYTSSENVLVFINKTDNSVSPTDSRTESEQQGSLVDGRTVCRSVDDRTVCRGMQDHTYFSRQSFSDHKLLTRQDSTHNTCTTEGEKDQKWKHEMLCRGLLDHTYFSRQNPANENVLSNGVPNTCRLSTHKADKDELLKKQNHLNNVTVNNQGSTQCCSEAMLESSNLEYNIKVEDDLCEFEPIQEDVVIGEYEESILGSDHEDSDSLPIDDLVYTSQDDLYSDTMSGTSTNNNCDTSEEACKTKIWNVCQKQNENTTQKSLLSVDSVNSNPAARLYKDMNICTCCGLSKVSDTKTAMERCTCMQFICSLCGIVFGTEEILLNHQADMHPLAKYMCVRCLQLFPNQKIFRQHICSESKGFSGECLTASNSSDNPKEPLLMILNFVPSPAAAEPSKQAVSSQSVNFINTDYNLGAVSNSTSHSLLNGPSTSATQNIPVQVMATRSSSAQNKMTACLVLNGAQGQVMTPVSPVTQNQNGQGQVLSMLHTKVVTQSSSSSSFSSSSSSSSMSTQILLSSQGQGQMTPISTGTQTQSGQMQDFTPLQTRVVTPTHTGSTELATSIVLPQHHPSFGVHLPHPVLSQVSSSMSIPSPIGQLPKSNVPFLDISRTPSTQLLPSSQGPLKIVAMFVNQSKELALQKRMCQSWRSKAVFPCRQCGAVSRQFSLGVRHRYQHRGPRLYRCQCGRAFQQRMHLLRHQVQHAEATRYVCAACGQMFCGTQRLACHRPLFKITPASRKKQATKECRNIFQCYCGHSFTRPAALLWHMLKNSKARKPRLKGVRIT